MSANALSAVLAHVDRELDASLDRLFALLRIQSISTDPAYTAQCRNAADYVAADLGSLGFDAGLRPLLETHAGAYARDSAGGVVALAIIADHSAQNSMHWQSKNFASNVP